MKNIINLMALSLLMMGLSCDKQNGLSVSPCDEECIFVEELINVKAKVVNFTHSNLFVLTTDSISLTHPGYVVGSNNILVPCNPLDKFYATNENIVIISGFKLNCCKQLTLPSLRTGFGCRFEITSIKLLKDI